MARRGRLGPWYLLGIALIKPLSTALWRRGSSGREHLPATGGMILAANHISLADPAVLCHHVVFDLGLTPRFLAKSGMFVGGGPVARVMRGAGQIPVHRETAGAAKALDAAVAALTAEVEAVRGEAAPPERHDPRAALPADDGRRTA